MYPHIDNKKRYRLKRLSRFASLRTLIAALLLSTSFIVYTSQAAPSQNNPQPDVQIQSTTTLVITPTDDARVFDANPWSTPAKIE
jgi:hypothetical protein